MQKLLSAQGITHSFEYELFNDISLELYSTNSIAIIGASGSGKSTLLHILSTLLEPKKGTLELFGKDSKALSMKELQKIKRDKLGLVFQSHYLFKGFSAYENLEVAALLSQESIDKKLLERLDIAQVIEQKVTELSGGQQQRVSIARVLTKQPKIIFADEPTGNLDKQTALNVMNLFYEYIKSNDAAMILVTHDEELAFMCDSVYRLEDRVLKKVQG